ncbi:hypothetical protein ACEQ8H_000313 [Pleosporales sp. CAS-2024a]
MSSSYTSSIPQPKVCDSPLSVLHLAQFHLAEQYFVDKYQAVVEAENLVDLFEDMDNHDREAWARQSLFPLVRDFLASWQAMESDRDRYLRSSVTDFLGHFNLV